MNLKRACSSWSLTLGIAALGLAACGTPRAAKATLEPRSSSSLSGTATFTEKDGQVEVSLEVAGASPGLHGAHIHDKGDCSAADATSAGGHWALEGEAHGSGEGGHHIGDLGNLEVGADGRGALRLSKAAWKLGSGDLYDVVGHAVVIHAVQDDLTSQPAGNSGARIGCGVIQQQNP